MIHVVTLRKVISYKVRIDEEFEGELETLTPAEAVESAKDMADEMVFISWDDNGDYEVVTEGEWDLLEQRQEAKSATPEE